MMKDPKAMQQAMAMMGGAGGGGGGAGGMPDMSALAGMLGGKCWGWGWLVDWDACWLRCLITHTPY